MVGGSGSGTTKTSAPPTVAFISSTPPYWSAIQPGITYVGCLLTFVPLRRIASYPAVNHAGSSSSLIAVYLSPRLRVETPGRVVVLHVGLLARSNMEGPAVRVLT